MPASCTSTSAGTHLGHRVHRLDVVKEGRRRLADATWERLNDTIKFSDVLKTGITVCAG